MAKIDGIMSFGGNMSNVKPVWVSNNQTSHKQEHFISHRRNIFIYEDDFVNKGQNITDGKQDPHEIIKILGESSLHEYLISETHKVYRIQVVKINIWR